jgi:hypothetical protein
MIYEFAAMEHETVVRELRQVFDEATTEVLGRVLGRMAARMQEIQVTRDEFRELRATVTVLVEAQARTEARVHELAEAQARTEARVHELAEAQLRTEARVTGLEDAVHQLVEAQARTEAEVRRLAEAQMHTAQDVAGLKGHLLELKYQQRAGAYFGPLLRRVRALLPVELEDDLEARLSPEEFSDLLQLDLLVKGRPRYREEAPEVWLAVETSAVIDRHDVERALQRAGYLRRAGYRAIPTVTGERATKGANQEAETHKVLMLLDGQAIFWEEALEEVLS